ncbi:cyclase family protein [Rhodobacter sp. NTK016B]|uniref:cyclase family protein n=1 Tax=Rhodobacter sp. NTK016B TaxID=2759676 RepID=UPI001A8F330A|nr:cyclase family protein [Rhodobacter sp. NTK016B]MBN8292426.1 cyclase family protein [Rhodobacter sp. NTK016B]
MPRRIVDLSVTLKAGIKSDPPPLVPKIRYLDHAHGATDFAAMLGIEPSEMLGGAGPASEELEVTTHVGTHLDAPWHYHPTMNNGERAITIDEVPLDWCMGPGVKLDFRALPDGHVVTAAEIEAEFKRIGHDLQPGDIVLVNTSAGLRYGHDDYLSKGCGIGREATLWMTERGMRVCGTDAWSWDTPLVHQKRQIAETGNKALAWEGHKAGAEAAYCHMEKLSNLETLPATGYTVCAFPVKVEKGSAGWVRAVAIFDE